MLNNVFTIYRKIQSKPLAAKLDEMQSTSSQIAKDKALHRKKSNAKFDKILTKKTKKQ